MMAYCGMSLLVTDIVEAVHAKLIVGSGYAVFGYGSQSVSSRNEPSEHWAFVGRRASRAFAAGP